MEDKPDIVVMAPPQNQASAAQIIWGLLLLTLAATVLIWAGWNFGAAELAEAAGLYFAKINLAVAFFVAIFLRGVGWAFGQ